LDDFGLRDTFQKRIAPKSIEIDMEKLRIKFSTLDVYFNGSSIDYSRSKKLRHEGIKNGTPVKVVILPLLISLS